MRRRLHVDVPKVRTLENHPVGHAIQRNPAGQANLSLPRLLLDKIQEGEIILLQH